MKVRCDEGLAIHVGPEPCACLREEAGEASAGERTGQPLVRQAKLARSCRCKSGPGKG